MKFLTELKNAVATSGALIAKISSKINKPAEVKKTGGLIVSNNEVGLVLTWWEESFDGGEEWSEDSVTFGFEVGFSLVIT
mgnify:CR=1 FL=1